MTLSNWIGLITNIVILLAGGGILLTATRKVHDLDGFEVLTLSEDAEKDATYIPLD